MNFQIKRFVLVLFVLFGILLGISTTVFAADPSFYISPLSGSDLKLHCRYTFNAKLSAGGQSYNGFYHTIMFDSGALNLTHSSVDSFFSSSPNGYIKSGYLYKAYGAATVGNTSDRNLTTFVLYTISNITNTTLNFTNCDGGAITFGTGTTADCEVLNGYTVGGQDILAGLEDASYNFSPLPCVPDTKSPYITSVNIGNGATQIPNNQIISFIATDQHGAGSVSGPAPLETNNRVHYRYQGLATTLGNYVAAPSTVDNQEGVNFGSIKITVTAPNYPAYGTYILSGTDLSGSNYGGDGTSNQYTWDSEIRGYNVAFNPPSPYPVEKQINVDIVLNDRPNETGAIHTGTSSFSFNAPIAPTSVMLSPSPITFVNPSLTEISFYLSDDRAGIDTGSVSFTIPAIYSGATLLMSGYTYSGSDLTFVLSGGGAGLGNGGDYVVSFSPQRNFPNNTGVSITGIFLDLAGSTGIANFSFTTRPGCDYFGCSEILRIHIGVDVYEFSGSLVMINGTGYGYSPNVPYLSGDTLICSLNYNGATLTGNVDLLSNTGISINGMLYTNNNIYITGLDFSYQNGVIVIPD